MPKNGDRLWLNRNGVSGRRVNAKVVKIRVKIDRKPSKSDVPQAEAIAADCPQIEPVEDNPM